jgi:hypothetical protein
MKYNIIISGRIPSKKNSKIMICRGPRPILLPSAAHKAWHTEQSYKLKKIKTPIEKCTITANFYAPDNRATDLSNKWESIGDLLVDNGILKDDNWNVIVSLHLRYCGLDKENPRAELSIEEC